MRTSDDIFSPPLPPHAPPPLHMSLFLLSALGLFLSPVLVASECSLACSYSNCTTTPALASECLLNPPYNKTWADSTLDVLTQSLENFGKTTPRIASHNQ